MAISKEQWRERLLKAGVQEEVVDATLKGMGDEDFARMKDMEPDEIMAALKDAKVIQEDADDTEDDTETDDSATNKDDSEELMDLTDAFESLKDELVSQIKDALGSHETELEIPALADITSKLDALTQEIQTIKDGLSTLMQSEEQRLMQVAKDLSPASKARLIVHAKDAGPSDTDIETMSARIGAWFKDVQDGDGDGVTQKDGEYRPIIKDASGRTYKSLGDMLIQIPASD